jgi:hypothetical protein
VGELAEPLCSNHDIQSKNIVNHGTSKHYRIAQHFNRKQVENKMAYFDYMSTKENEADMFIQEFRSDVFNSHRVMIASPTSPTRGQLKVSLIANEDSPSRFYDLRMQGRG